MIKKYVVEFDKEKKLFDCEPNNLKNHVQAYFFIKQSFRLQIQNDSQKWVDVNDITEVPTKSYLKVQLGT